MIKHIMNMLVITQTYQELIKQVPIVDFENKLMLLLQTIRLNIEHIWLLS